MSRRQHLCPSCGEPIPSLFGSLIHCDPHEPVDDLNDDDTNARPSD